MPRLPSVGTELVASGDKLICELLDTSPGAFTAAFIAIEVLEKRFADRLTPDIWLPAPRYLIPTYGIDLKQNTEAYPRTKTETASLLQIWDV